MRRGALVVFVLLVAVAPALGDDATKKHQVDARISSLQARAAAHHRRETALRGEVAGYTAGSARSRRESGTSHSGWRRSRATSHCIRSRLTRSTSCSRSSPTGSCSCKGSTRRGAVLDRRLVDIYESDPPSSLDVFLGAPNVQDALDQVAYLTDIGVQERRIAAEVSYAKVQAKAARTRRRRSERGCTARQR